MDSNINAKNNKVTFNLPLKVYSLDAILGASYLFIDKAYVFFDCDGKDKVVASFKGKKKLSKKDMDSLVGEFHNELLNQTLRVKLSKKNQKIREYIVQQALYPGAAVQEQELPTAVDAELDKELDEILKEADSGDYGDDPLGISVPWEEKHNKGSKQIDNP